MVYRKKATTVNDMKNMLYNLSDFKEKKGKYSLHISMAHECMKVFENHKLSTVGIIEQVLLIFFTIKIF